MNYSEINIGESIAFGPVSLTIENYDYPECPWNAWDGCAPLLANNSDGFTVYGGEDLRDVFADMPDHWFSRHWRKLCEILDLCPNEHDQIAKEEQRDYGASLSYVRREMFADCLAHGLNRTDTMEALAEIWRLRGRPAIVKAVNGYCQGHWADVLLVETEEYCKTMEFTPDENSDKRLESDARLWGAWAYGDVFGYVVERDGETLDACAGYYGCPWGNNPGPSWDVADEGFAALAMELRKVLGDVRADYRDKLRAWLESRETLSNVVPVPTGVGMDVRAELSAARAKVRDVIAGIRKAKGMAK